MTVNNQIRKIFHRSPNIRPPGCGHHEHAVLFPRPRSTSTLATSARFAAETDRGPIIVGRRRRSHLRRREELSATCAPPRAAYAPRCGLLRQIERVDGHQAGARPGRPVPDPARGGAAPPDPGQNRPGRHVSLALNSQIRGAAEALGFHKECRRGAKLARSLASPRRPSTQLASSGAVTGGLLHLSSDPGNRFTPTAHDRGFFPPRFDVQDP